MSVLCYELRPPRPYALERTAARLVRFPELVNRFEDGVFSRLLDTPGAPTLVRVRQVAPASRALLQVELAGRAADRKTTAPKVAHALEHLLGTAQPVSGFYRRFRADPFLGPLIRRFSGLRVAGTETLFEALVTAICAQQIQLSFAYRLRRDLVLAFGKRARIEGETRRTFPTPRALAKADPAALRGFGFSRNKTEALLGLARAFEGGALSEHELAALPDEKVVETLLPLRGIGRWTAEIGLLRGLARMDAFPGADLAVIKYLAVDLLGRETKASEREMRELAEQWRPWRGLALAYALEELAARD